MQAVHNVKRLILAAIILYGCGRASDSEPAVEDPQIQELDANLDHNGDQEHELEDASLVKVKSTSRELFIVAHQDDDLLFINPYVQNAIRANAKVLTVYLSAGDAGRTRSYWRKRERGIEAAYAQMSKVKNSWITKTYTYRGKKILFRTLSGKPKVRLMYLRLPDGNLSGNGFKRTKRATLKKLWSKQISSLKSVDGVNTFTRSELIGLLTAIMKSTNATNVSTMDDNTNHGHDHSDHVHAAKFARQAHKSFNAKKKIWRFRGYNAVNLKANLSERQFKEKFTTLKAYTAFDPLTCQKSCGEDGLYGRRSRRAYRY